MIRWFTVLCFSMPLWHSCEKQGRRLESGAGSVSHRHAPQSPLASISQSRKAHESTSTHPVTTEQDRAYELVKKIWNVIHDDPVAAWRDVELRNIPEDDRRAILGQCTMILTGRDRDAALDWVRSLPSSTDRAYALSRWAVVWAADDPAAAADFLKTQGIHGHDDMVAAVQILQLWAQRSGADASVWALSLSSSSLRQSGLEAVSEQWLLHDAPGYGRWLANQQQSGTYSTLLAATREVLLRQIPEKRRDFLQQWPEALRQQVLSAVESVSD
jgi:hypothetical protein